MIARQGQSFLDLVVQGTGSVDEAFDMALLNNARSITDDVIVGEEYTAGAVKKRTITSLFLGNHLPATAITGTGGLVPVSGGIGYMGIEIDFIIS